MANASHRPETLPASDSRRGGQAKKTGSLKLSCPLPGIRRSSMRPWVSTAKMGTKPEGAVLPVTARKATTVLLTPATTGVLPSADSNANSLSAATVSAALEDSETTRPPTASNTVKARRLRRIQNPTFSRRSTVIDTQSSMVCPTNWRNFQPVLSSPPCVCFMNTPRICSLGSAKYCVLK